MYCIKFKCVSCFLFYLILILIFIKNFIYIEDPLASSIYFQTEIYKKNNPESSKSRKRVIIKEDMVSLSSVRVMVLRE